MMTTGIVLLVAGIIGLVIGRFMRPTRTVSANHGSVAVGGDANAPITVTASSAKEASVDPLFWWNITCGVATLLGLVLGALSLALTLWPPHH